MHAEAVGCGVALPPTQDVRLGFENLLEVTDWVHTLQRETSYSHYPVIAVTMNSKVLFG